MIFRIYFYQDDPESADALEQRCSSIQGSKNQNHPQSWIAVAEDRKSKVSMLTLLLPC